MSASYTKLRDGSWGVRVQASQPPSGSINVTTKAGKVKSETVHKVLWSADGIHLCSVKMAKKTSPECPRCGEELTPGTPCWECGYR